MWGDIMGSCLAGAPTHLLLPALLLTLPRAEAQEAVNGLGPLLVPGSAGAGTPLYAWKPERQQRWGLTVQSLLDYARAPVVAYSFEPDGAVTREALLDHVAGMDLGLSLGLSERLAAQLSLPSSLSAQTPDGATGPGIGDLRLSAPVGLVLPGRLQGFGLAIVPTLTVPTADPAKLLGRGAWNAGATLAYSYDAGVWSLVANTGLEASQGLTAARDLLSEPRLLAELAASWRPSPGWALSLEGLYQPSLPAVGEVLPWARSEAIDTLTARVAADCLRRGRASEAEPTSVDCTELSDPLTGADSPGQILLYLQHTGDNGLFWTVGGGVGGTNGTGTPDAEGYVSVGWSPDDSDADDTAEDEEDGDPITPCEEPALTVETQDMACDEEDSASAVAELAPSEGCSDYQYRWEDEDGVVVSSSATAQNLSPGVYTVTATYTALNKLGMSKTEKSEATVSVGYALSWEELKGAEIADDATSLEHGGPAAEWRSAVSRNVLAADAEGWVELDVPEDLEHRVALGLVPPEASGTAPVSNGWQSGNIEVPVLSGSLGVLAGRVWKSSTTGAGEAVESGDRLRVERGFEGGKTVLTWWHDGVEVDGRTWSSGESGAPEGELHALGAVYGAGDVLLRPRASFGCAAPPPFVPLQMALDGSFHTPVGQVLRFRYEERYHAHDLPWTITDRGQRVVASGAVPVAHGLNWIELDLAGLQASPALEVDAWYVFEVTDARGQRQMLRFRYE